MKKIKRYKLCFTFNQGVVSFMPFIITDAIILKYLNDGFSYLEMVELLSHAHDFQISLSNRKRWLNDSNLKRRPIAAVCSSNEEIRQAVQE